MLRDMREELAELDSRLAGYNWRIQDLFRANEMCQRIGQIEGVGPITATALVAAVGDKILLQEWSSICRVAGARSKATVKRWKSTLVRDQQAR